MTRWRTCKACLETKDVRAFHVTRKHAGKVWRTDISKTCRRCDKALESRSERIARLREEATMDRLRSQRLCVRAWRKEQEAKDLMERLYAAHTHFGVDVSAIVAVAARRSA